MALALVQSAGNAAASNSGTVTATAAISAATAGNLLVVTVAVSSTSSVVPTITGPSGFTLAITSATPGAASPSRRVSIFYRAAAGGETSISASKATGVVGFCAIEVMEFSGSPSWLLDKTASNNSGFSVTSLTTGSTGTLSTASEVAVGMVGLDTPGAGGVETWNTSFTSINHSTSNQLTGYLLTAATTALNPTGSWSTAVTGPVSAIATFQQGSVAVDSDLDLRWQQAGAVDSDLDLRWKQGGAVDADLTLSWDVKGPVGAFGVRAEVAWTTEPLTRPGPGDWSDLADVEGKLQKLDIKRGVTILSAGIETGTASAVLNNTTRALDPSYMTSPLSPNVKPRKRIRYVMTVRGVDVPLHTGFIERYLPTWSLANASVTIPSQDLFGILANVTLPPSVIDVETRALSPMAYWPLSETSGTGADDVVGAYDGTYTLDAAGGSPIVPYESRPANKLQTTGRGVVVTGITSASGERMVSFWILADALPAAGAIELFSMFSPSTSDKWAVTTNTAGVLRVEVTNGASTRTIIYTDVIASGAVHHVVVGVKAGTNTVTALVDDVPATPSLDSGSVSFGSVLSAATTARISYATPGTTPATSAPGADFSNVALWDRILTGAEVTRINDAGTNPWDGDRTDERADRICDLIGIDPDDRDFDVCTQTCGPTLLGSQNALGYFRKIVATEAGVGYVTGDGKIRLRARPTEPLAVQTFTDAPDIDDGVPCFPLTPDYSYDRVVNTLTGKRENNAEQTVVDPTSAATYGPLAGAGGNLDTLHRSAADLRTTLQLLINVRKNWGTYIPSVTVAAVDRGVTLDSLVHVEIGDLVSVRARPTGAVEELIFVDAQVEAVGYSFPAFGQLRTTYSLGDGVATEASFEWDTVGRGWDESYWLEGTPFAFDIEDHGWDSGFWTED